MDIKITKITTHYSKVTNVLLEVVSQAIKYLVKIGLCLHDLYAEGVRLIGRYLARK